MSMIPKRDVVPSGLYVPQSDINIRKLKCFGYSNMSKKVTFIIIFIILGIIAYLTINNNSKDSQRAENSSVLANPDTNITSSAPQSIAPADKIEVVHFHGTQQCWSCITVGEFALQTIKEKFPDEYDSGKIVFKDINGELPENREIVVKYQARGSSLFINALRDKQDNIQEEIKVWYLVNNEEQFIGYFEKRLNTLLGK